MKIKISANFSEPRAKTFFRFHLLRRAKIRYGYYAVSLFLILISTFCMFILNEDIIATIIFAAGIAVLIIWPIQVQAMVKKIIASNQISGAKYIITFDDDKLN